MRLIRMLFATAAGLILFGLMAMARAGTYDPESRWMERTAESRPSRMDCWKCKQDPRRQPRKAHGKPLRRHYYVAPSARAPRHAGITVEPQCPFGPLVAHSHERQAEETAWDDAQRAWQNAVRWKHGERYQAIQHAASIERRCSVSTVSESIAGKAIEAARGAIGLSDEGRRWRCEIRAIPCIAPVEIGPKINGDR